MSSDPRLVSYVRPELCRIMPQLDRARDCWDLLPRDGADNPSASVRASYLPREMGEPFEAYQGRLMRSSYTSAYRDAIRAFSGLLSRFQLMEPPASLAAAENDVDLRGSSLRRFLSTIDKLVLRDGAAAVLVEMPPADPNVASAIEERKAGRRPYAVLLERAQVINWRAHLSAGREVLEMVVLKLEEEAEPEEGAYGCETREVFMVMVPGAWRKVALKYAVNGQPVEEEIASGTTSLQEIPLVWFGSTTNQMGESDVLMDSLASLSILHMQTRSDLAELIHRCALPVAVRVGDTPNPDGSPRPLIVGPNSAMDLPEGGSFTWAEPGGSSLQRHQEEVQHIEALMKEASLAFLWGEGSGGRTATEASLASGQISAQVRDMIEGKTSAFRQVMELWAAYMSETLSEAAGLSISDSLVQRPLDPNGTAQIVNLHTNTLISHQTTLEELKRGGVLDPDLDVEDELKRIGEERRAQAKAAQGVLAPTPPPADGVDPFAPQPADQQGNPSPNNGNDPMQNATTGARQ